MCRPPVRRDISLETKFSLEDAVESRIVFTGESTVDCSKYEYPFRSCRSHSYSDLYNRSA